MLERSFTQVETEALALINAAKNLSSAYDSGDEMKMVEALDNNLTVWVAIKTFALDKTHKLAQETKDNLVKLSDFVASRTLRMAQNMDEKTISTFVNNNLMIAEGLLENTSLSAAEEDAFALVNSAVHMSDAKDSDSEGDLVAALDDNMKLWVAIKTMVEKKKDMPAEVKQNIMKMADFVVASTVAMGEKLDMGKVDAMINVNLQIAEGLLAGKEMSKAEEDAFALLRAAVNLANARDNKKDEELVEALEENIALWVAIGAVMEKGKSAFACDIKENLMKLSKFAVGKSIKVGQDMDYSGIDALVNMNLQICEGLLERAGGMKTSMKPSYN